MQCSLGRRGRNFKLVLFKDLTPEFNVCYGGMQTSIHVAFNFLVFQIMFISHCADDSLQGRAQEQAGTVNE